MKSEYVSGKSVGKNQTVPIAADDRRLRWDKRGPTKGRQGAEIDIVGLNTTLSNQILYNNLTMGNSTGSSALAYGSSAAGSSALPKGYYPVVAYGSYLGVYPNGSGPYVLVPTDPGTPTVTWVGDTLKIEFDYDVLNPINITVSQFIVQITAEGITASTPLNTFPINRSQSRQTLLLTPTINEQMFNFFEVNIDSLTVQAADPLGNISSKVAALSVPPYSLDFAAPTTDGLKSGTGGYSFNVTNVPTSSAYDAIDVWEVESDGLTQPEISYNAGTKTPSNYTRVYFQKINPVFVSTPNGKQRYVAVRFSSRSRKYTDFTLLGKITPSGSANFDPTAPNAPSVNSSDVSWSGGDLNIQYTLNATKPGNRVGIYLTHTDSSNIIYSGTFYFFPDSTNVTTKQTATIHAADMQAQFGAYYPNFQHAEIFSTSLAGVQSDSTTFTVPDRSNDLVGITPTVSASPAANGYIVTWSQTAGTYADVYAKTTPWTSYPIDETQRVYSGKSPVTIQSLDYANTQYILIRLYNDYGQYSNYSALTPVVSAQPYDPGALSLIDSPVSFQTNGSILAGNLNSTRVIFNKDGLFAYGSNGTPTTEIINTATGNTFMTSQAQIADWQITNNKIENTITPLGSSAQTYTGLSGTGSYAFWAGATQTSTSGPVSDSQSAFWVKPNGSVQATNISIKGGSLDIGGSVTVVKTITAIAGSKTITVSDNSGILTGMYLLANNVPANSTVQSIVSNTITMSTATTGAVSGTGYFVSSVGAHITGSGLLVAQGATLSGSIVATSGLFSGDVGIGSSGALYSGTIVTAGSPAKGTGNVKNGYVLSSDGLTFYDNNASYVTDINAATGKLRTQLAQIGLWNVNETSIYTGNLSLNSSGKIEVTAADTTTYKAGINAATSGASTIFYAGSGTTPDDSANKFRVTMDGTIYGKGGQFTGGSVTSSGSLGTVTIDGVNDLISLSTGTGSSKYTSYIMPRNNNLYIISPSLPTDTPWGSAKGDPSTTGTITSAPTSKPYFAAGSSFKDSWNNSVSGIGIYTGGWDYYNSPTTTKPFITASTTGLQLAAAGNVGIIVEDGTKNTLTNPSVLTLPSVLIYTSQDTTNYSPSTAYGAYILAEPKKITMFSNNPTSGSFPVGGIIIDNNAPPVGGAAGTAQGAGVYIYAGTDKGVQQAFTSFNSTGITMQATTSKVQEVITKDTITIQSTNGATGGDIQGVWSSSGITIQSNDTVKGVWDGTSIKLQSTSSIYGSWDSSGITFQSGLTAYTTWNSSGITISPSSGSLTYIKVDGSKINMQTVVTPGTYIGSDGQSHNQPATQKISFASDGLHINGLTVYGDDSRLSYIGGTYNPEYNTDINGTSYAPFTRAITWAPQSKDTGGTTHVNGSDAVAGFAVYYASKSPVGTTGTGFSGDLWVQI